MAQLIDSSVFIALERRKQPLGTLSMVVPDEPVALASITASELLAGVHRADTQERQLRRQAFVEAILEVITVVPFDLRVARIHAQIWSRLLASGHTIGAHDLLIAATAMTHGYAVLTDNTREFYRVKGLEVRQPDWQNSH